MNELTRRRDPESAKERWRIYFGDVQVGSIGQRSGVPTDAEQWDWSCGFYPGLGPRECQDGTAIDFDHARRAFERAWSEIKPKCTEDRLQEWRLQKAFTAWKYAMWDAKCRMPAQAVVGWTRCFCGAAIDSKGTPDHIIACHMDLVA